MWGDIKELTYYLWIPTLYLVVYVIYWRPGMRDYQGFFGCIWPKRGCVFHPLFASMVVMIELVLTGLFILEKLGYRV